MILTRPRRILLLKQADKSETRRHSYAKKLHLMRVGAIQQGKLQEADEFQRRCNELGYDPRELSPKGNYLLKLLELVDTVVADQTITWMDNLLAQIKAASAGKQFVPIQICRERGAAS